MLAQNWRICFHITVVLTGWNLEVPPWRIHATRTHVYIIAVYTINRWDRNWQKTTAFKEMRSCTRGSCEDFHFVLLIQRIINETNSRFMTLFESLITSKTISNLHSSTFIRHDWSFPTFFAFVGLLFYGFYLLLVIFTYCFKYTTGNRFCLFVLVINSVMHGTSLFS